MKQLFFATIFCLPVLCLNAQIEIVWSQIIGGSEFDEIYAITPNGSTYEGVGGAGSNDFFFENLMNGSAFQLEGKLADGTIQSAVFEFSDEVQFALDIISNESETVGLFYGLDTIAAIESITVQALGNDGFIQTIQSPNSNLAFPHHIYFGAAGEYWITSTLAGDLSLIKMSAENGLIWRKSYGGSSNEYPGGLVALPDGGVVIAANSYSDDGQVGSNNGLGDTWLFALDNEGEILWSKGLGVENEEQVRYLDQTPDGGYIVLRNESFFDGQIIQGFGQLVKTDQEGNIEWEHSTSEYLNGYVTLHKVISLSDGRYLMAGNQFNAIASDIVLAMIDADGEMEWFTTFGGPSNEFITDFEQVNEEEFLVVATTEGKGGDVPDFFGAGDAWIFKLKLMEGVSSSKEVALQSLELFPNPVQAGEVVRVLSEDAFLNQLQVELINTSGQVVRQIEGNQTFQIPADIPQGMYFLKASAPNQQWMEKLIVR